MIHKIMVKIRKKIDYIVYDVGKEVYWERSQDSVYGRYSGYYIIKSRIDKNGRVDIYNEDKGMRTVPYYYLDSVEETIKRRERESVRSGLDG